MIPVSNNKNKINNFNKELFKNKEEELYIKDMMSSVYDESDSDLESESENYSYYCIDEVYRPREEGDQDDDYRDETYFDSSEYEILKNTTENLIKVITENSNNVAENKKNEKPYIYCGGETLNRNLDELLLYKNNIPEKIKVHVCSYHINEEGKHPFLQFFLLKRKTHQNIDDYGDKEDCGYENCNEEDVELVFPTFDYINKINLISKSISVMDVICKSYFKNIKYEFKGGNRIDNNITQL